MNSTVTVWDFDDTRILQSNIRKNSDTKINENPYNWNRFVP